MEFVFPPFKLWKNKGLSKVYYSSKGYFTFRFNQVHEKDAVLSLNTAVMGGKTLYLQPWMEGSKFKKNVVTKVPCWLRLVDVPHSYWSRAGLSSIARGVGKPLKFDEATARFEPLKYASVQVELEYGGHRPDYAWVDVVCKGVKDREKVKILYPQLPYSCSLCKAFGHSLARCLNNPDAVRHNRNVRQPQRKRDRDEGISGSHAHAENRTGDSSIPYDDLLNSQGMVPYVVGRLAGCDVVMDEDQILHEEQANNIIYTNLTMLTQPVHKQQSDGESSVLQENLERGMIPYVAEKLLDMDMSVQHYDMENVDTDVVNEIPPDPAVNNEEDSDEDNLEEFDNHAPVHTKSGSINALMNDNSFAMLDSLEDGELLEVLVKSPNNSKRRQRKISAALGSLPKPVKPSQTPI